MAQLRAHQSTKPSYLYNLRHFSNLHLVFCVKIYYGPFTGSPESPQVDSNETIHTRRYVSSKGSIAREEGVGVVYSGGLQWTSKT